MTMTNTEILQCFLLHISLHSHKIEDMPVQENLIAQARGYIGLDIKHLRDGINNDDVLNLILLDIERQINKCDWNGVEKNFILFDRMAIGKKVRNGLRFDRWYFASIAYHRRGFLAKALKATEYAECYAQGHFPRYKLLLLRGNIECDNLKRYEFAVNSLSSALYEAEQIGDLYVAKVYHQLARMCSVRYAALGMSFLRKAQALCERIGDKDMLTENKMARVNSYYVLSLSYPKDEKIFLDEAKHVLESVDYDSLPLLQNKMYYKELLGDITHDVVPIIEACKFYIKIDSVDEICRLCDSILEKGINYQQAAKALPYIDLYRKTAIRRNDKNLELELKHIQEMEGIIYGILGK